LRKLGVEADILVLVANDFGAETEAVIAALWDCNSLNSGYVESAQQLTRWLEHVNELEPEVAARESWILCGNAIRQLIHDPWLPEPMINRQLRHHFFVETGRINVAGRKIWNGLNLAGSSNASPSLASYPDMAFGVSQ